MLVGGEILIGGMDFNGEKGRGGCTGFALGVIRIFLGEGSCGGSRLRDVRGGLILGGMKGCRGIFRVVLWWGVYPSW